MAIYVFRGIIHEVVVRLRWNLADLISGQCWEKSCFVIPVRFDGLKLWDLEFRNFQYLRRNSDSGAQGRGIIHELRVRLRWNLADLIWGQRWEMAYFVIPIRFDGPKLWDLEFRNFQYLRSIGDSGVQKHNSWTTLPILVWYRLWSTDNEYRAEIVLHLLPITVPNLAESNDLKEKWRFLPIFPKFASGRLFET